MSSYFANSYIPDLRNGGVEHPHQHQQHYGAAVQVPQQTQSVQQQSQQAGDPCDPSLLRQGVPGHHYGAAGSQQDIPYPRFPPYNRMDMRNATYYQHQQEHGSMDGMGGYRSTSPSPGMGHMGHTPTPNGHPSTPIAENRFREAHVVVITRRLAVVMTEVGYDPALIRHYGHENGRSQEATMLNLPFASELPCPLPRPLELYSITSKEFFYLETIETIRFIDNPLNLTKLELCIFEEAGNTTCPFQIRLLTREKGLRKFSGAGRDCEESNGSVQKDTMWQALQFLICGRASWGRGDQHIFSSGKRVSF
ncbi:hypothetical protein E2986_13040 [Frieseomelitta varia]|uniref:Uncharacterized protein n=1 Tax=Frieseomelitta varia TaxID=561572 RepID=A0A833RV37_9HYME|nr:hypothetical protein E2986_13040 [Frieseomelitta varia]